MALGAELLAALLERARREGFERISLSVEPGSAQGLFYERFGFATLREGVMVASLGA